MRVSDADPCPGIAEVTRSGQISLKGQSQKELVHEHPALPKFKITGRQERFTREASK